MRPPVAEASDPTGGKYPKLQQEARREPGPLQPIPALHSGEHKPQRKGYGVEP